MKQCRDCKKWGTMGCPESRECYTTINKPFFEPKKEKSQSWIYAGKKLWHCTLILVVMFGLAAILERLLGVPRSNTYDIYIGVLLSFAYDYFKQDKQ